MWRDQLAGSKIITLRRAAILAVSIVLIRLALLAIIKDKGTFLPIDDVIVTLASGLATFGMLYAGLHSDGKSRIAWFVLAAAQLAYTFGEAAWTVTEVVLHQNPFLSVADIGYFAFYPIFVLSILILPSAPLSSRERLKILLDIGIAVSAFILIFWAFIIAPIIASGDALTLKLAVSVAYPIMDVLLFVALMELVFRKLSSASTAPFSVLAVGLVMLLITDVIFSVQTQAGTYASGGLLDTGWLISYMIFWLAGVLQASGVPFDALAALSKIYDSRVAGAQYLSYLGIGATFSFLDWGYQNSGYIDKSIVSVAICIIFVLMFIRQKVTLDESNQLLDEKEVLLKEVHHRVKNNLQVISALLYLQSSNLTDDNAIKIFRDSQNRIKSMALIHENLYKSKDLEKVNFNEYIKQLISHLSQSYGDLSHKINFKINSNDIYMNINTAIPCGMIINELISNSIKYAFRDGRNGEICIGLSSENDNFKLVVSDNGVGIKGDLNIKDSKTLGFRLIYTLVRQIDGKMSLDTTNGTRCEIHFKGLN